MVNLSTKLIDTMAVCGFALWGNDMAIPPLSREEVSFVVRKYPYGDRIDSNALREGFINNYKKFYQEGSKNNPRQIQFYHEYDEINKRFVPTIMISPRSFRDGEVRLDDVNNSVLQIHKNMGLYLIELSKLDGLLVLRKMGISYNPVNGNIIENCKALTEIYSIEDSGYIESKLEERAEQIALRNGTYPDVDLADCYRASKVMVPDGIRPIHTVGMNITRTGTNGNITGMVLRLDEDMQQVEETRDINRGPLFAIAENTSDGSVKQMVKMTAEGK